MAIASATEKSFRRLGSNVKRDPLGLFIRHMTVRPELTGRYLHTGVEFAAAASGNENDGPT